MVVGLNEFDYPYFPFKLHIDAVLVHKNDTFDQERNALRAAYEGEMRREGVVMSHEVRLRLRLRIRPSKNLGLLVSRCSASTPSRCCLRPTGGCASRQKRRGCTSRSRM